MTVTMNLFAIFLLLAIPERLSMMPFALYADAWACVPISTSRGKNASVHRSATISRAREFRALRGNRFIWSLRPLQRRKHCSISSIILSSSLPFFEEPSSTSLANRTSVAPSAKMANGEDSDSDFKPNNPNPGKNRLFFVRPAMFVDMDRASKILADGFFKGPDSNFFKYQWEKFITYLSLEAGFPRTKRERSRYEIFVACCIDTGEVWGLVEIDARGTTTARTSKVYEKSGGSPYMCNLAVDEKHKRKGIASSLVYECERQVKEWYSDDERRKKKENEETSDDDMVYNSKNAMINDIVGSNRIELMIKKEMSNSVCLKVRESNKAAVQMYLKLGYETVFEEPEDGKPNESILLMRKDLTPLPSPR